MTVALVGGTLVWLGFASAAQAHGLLAEVRASTPAIVVACAYTDGDPVDAEVLIYSPAEPGRIFQRLHTDIRGLASFVPDTAGTWRVVADDGMGHRTELELAVEEGTVTVVSSSTPSWSVSHLALAVAALVIVGWWIRHASRASRSESL